MYSANHCEGTGLMVIWTRNGTNGTTTALAVAILWIWDEVTALWMVGEEDILAQPHMSKRFKFNYLIFFVEDLHDILCALLELRQLCLESATKRIEGRAKRMCSY